MPRGGARPGAGRKSTDPISDSLIDEKINNLLRECDTAGLDRRILALQFYVRVTWLTVSEFSKWEREFFAMRIMQLTFPESDYPISYPNDPER